MYTGPVRFLTKLIGLTACLSLLSLQFSGLHLHADARGIVGGLEPVHVHGLGKHEDGRHGRRAHSHDHGHPAIADEALSRVSIDAHASTTAPERAVDDDQHDAARLQADSHAKAGDAVDQEENYAGARDVSLLAPLIDASAGQLALAPSNSFLVVDEPRAIAFVGTDFAYPVLSGRHTRWRPPLRAPPLEA